MWNAAGNSGILEEMWVESGAEIILDELARDIGKNLVGFKIQLGRNLMDCKKKNCCLVFLLLYRHYVLGIYEVVSVMSSFLAQKWRLKKKLHEFHPLRK